MNDALANRFRKFCAQSIRMIGEYSDPQEWEPVGGDVEGYMVTSTQAIEAVARYSLCKGTMADNRQLGAIEKFVDIRRDEALGLDYRGRRIESCIIAIRYCAALAAYQYVRYSVLEPEVLQCGLRILTDILHRENVLWPSPVVHEIADIELLVTIGLVEEILLGNPTAVLHSFDGVESESRNDVCWNVSQTCLHLAVSMESGREGGGLALARQTAAKAQQAWVKDLVDDVPKTPLFLILVLELAIESVATGRHRTESAMSALRRSILPGGVIAKSD